MLRVIEWMETEKAKVEIEGVAETSGGLVDWVEKQLKYLVENPREEMLEMVVAAADEVAQKRQEKERDKEDVINGENEKKGL